MTMDSVSGSELKRFVKHLCIVSKNYHDREQAQKNLQLHLERIKKDDNVERAVSDLSKKINILLEKEAKVAGLGIKKNVPVSIRHKIKLLEEELNNIQGERDLLSKENVQLKKAIDSIAGLQDTAADIVETNTQTEHRVDKIEERVDKRYHNYRIEELENKIQFLESSFKKISKDKSISPNRLYRIERRLKELKKRLKEIKYPLA